MSGNIVLLAKNLKRCYVYTKERLTDTYIDRRTKNLETDFFNYLYKQIGFEEFEQKLKERKEEMDAWESEVDSICHERFGVSQSFSYHSSNRINGTTYYLSSKLLSELSVVLAPIETSESLLSNITRFDKPDSPSIVGSNWKFKKIFPSFKATRTVNRQFVLKPEVVDELINNYFLAIKFGYNLEQLSLS